MMAHLQPGPCVTFLLFALSGVTSYSLTNVNDLHTQLFTTNGYNKLTRPMTDQSVATEVSIMFSLFAIHDVDFMGQALNLAAAVMIQWKDEALVWTPASFGGIEQAIYPQDDVWKPDIALKDSANDFKAIGNSELNVKVTYDGNVTWEPYKIFSSMCVFSVLYFPFDQQTCKVIFVSWDSPISDVILKGPDMMSSTSTAMLSEHPEWELLEIGSLSESMPKPMMTFTVVLKRKPSYVLCNIVLPLMALCIASVLVFLIPAQSGEVTGYAVTIFLTFMVFSELMHATLPPSSELSYLSLLAIVELYINAAVTMVAILFVRFAERTDKVPQWLITVVCGKAKNKRKDRPHSVTKIYPEDVKKSNDAQKSNPVKLYDVDTDVDLPDEAGDNDVDGEEWTWPRVITRLQIIAFMVTSVAQVMLFTTFVLKLSLHA